MNKLSSLLNWLGNTIGANPSTLATTSKTLVGAINEVKSTCNDVRNKCAPAGSIEMYAGANAPSGWLKCDGSAVSRTTYAALFAAIGTTYGAGDGSTTFNLPNFNGRTPIGVGTSGTTGASSHALASKGGQETHTHTTGNFTLTTSHIPSHTHVIAQRSGSGTSFSGWHWELSSGISDAVYNTNESVNRAASSIGSTGGGQAHNHGATGSTSQMNPFLTVNFIISTGV